MRIGLVTRGEVAYTLDLANQLSRAGQSVSLYLNYQHAVGEIGTSDRPAERFHEYGLIPADCRVTLFRLPRIRDPRSFEVLRKLGRTIRRDGIDVANLLVGSGELWLSVLPYFLQGIPITSTLTQPIRDIGEPTPFIVLWAFLKVLADKSDSIIVNGIDQPELIQQLYGVNPARVSYVPLSARGTAPRWAKTETSEESGTVLFFGRAVYHKGLEHLVRAQPIVSQRIPHARFLIAAHGSDLERCRRMIQDADRFEIHDGFVSGDVMATLFQRSSMVALPYLCSTSSGVLMTAYQFGKPVVATKVSGLSEYVENGSTGLLVAPGRSHELADAICKLLNNDPLRRSMGENARRWVDDLQEDVVQRTLSAYEKAIASRADGRADPR